MTPQRHQQLLRWLEIDATTGQEGAFLRTLEADLQAEGLQTSRLPVPGVDPQRYNLLASRAPDPELLLCTHIDTVPPFLPVRRQGDTFYGRGACDTKGVLLAMVEALARLHQQEPALAQRAGLLLVIGEEVDHCGAAAVPALGLRPRRILLGEPTLCEIAAGQKGILKVELRSEGVAGHSAFPEQGESAIDKLLDVLARLRALDWPTDPVLGPTLLNIGLLEGGVAANVFAPQARAVLMFRVVSDSHQVEALLRAQLQGQAQMQVLSRGEPQHFDQEHGEPTCILKFNSDAAWLRQVAPIWLGGPGDIRLAHSVDEQISAADLEAGAAMYMRLARRALAPTGQQGA